MSNVRGSTDPIWGSNGVPSLPAPIENTEALKVPMEGFCFTPYGLRVDVTEVDREDLLREGYGPTQSGGRVYGDE